MFVAEQTWEEGHHAENIYCLWWIWLHVWLVEYVLRVWSCVEEGSLLGTEELLSSRQNLRAKQRSSRRTKKIPTYIGHFISWVTENNLTVDTLSKPET